MSENDDAMEDLLKPVYAEILAAGFSDVDLLRQLDKQLRLELKAITRAQAMDDMPAAMQHAKFVIGITYLRAWVRDKIDASLPSGIPLDRRLLT